MKERYLEISGEKLDTSSSNPVASPVASQSFHRSEHGAAREIKFRAWIPRYGEMVELKNTGVQKFDCENGFSLMFTADGYSDIWAHENYGIDKEAVVMQYTGLKDKNGKDIYEGDITDRYKNVIMWSKKHALFCAHSYEPYFKVWVESSYPMDSETFKVIGNIYEHPHLLNSEQEAQVSDTTESEKRTER